MLRQDKPAHAIVKKTVEVVRRAATSTKARNTIGPQCSSLVLPSNRDEKADAWYHSKKIARAHYYPTYIKAVGDGTLDLISADLTIEDFDQAGRRQPLSIPKAGRNAPCPCGSGEKYKRCHGRRRSQSAPQVSFEGGAIVIRDPKLDRLVGPDWGNSRNGGRC
jgi:hypothetical protein